MKTKAILLHVLAATLFAGLAPAAAPLGTSFHYNGHLKENGSPASGGYNIQFTLWDAAVNGTRVGPIITLNGVTVTDGLLSASPDFGDVFNGDAYWLELAVDKGGSGNLVSLSPRQPLDAAPYALHAPQSGIANTAKAVNQDAVHTDGLKNGAVTGSKIAAKGVGNANLDDQAVSEDKIGSGAVGQDKLKDGAVGGNKISVKGVNNGHLDDNAVTADKIAAGHVMKSLNALKDDVTLAPGDGITLTPLGNTITVAATADTSDWKLGGNTGTSPAAQFLGTTDNASLTIKVNNAVVMRFQPTSTLVPNILGGYEGNYTTPFAIGVTIGGGGGSSPNGATDDYCVVGGGIGNQAGTANATQSDASLATVGGGAENKASAPAATIAGGERNEVTATHGAIGGGNDNRILGTGSLATDGPSTIAGGGDNLIDAGFATISGGRMNSIESGADYGMIPGGFGNTVEAAYGFAAGRGARAEHQGAFVWADSTAPDFVSENVNEFSVRATGGARFVSGESPVGTPSGVQLAAGGGSWSTLSDRNAKENFTAVDGRAVLERLSDIPLTTWNYLSQDKAIRHIGPMAQDFKAAFGVGEDDKHITTADADGIALAAIQGLNLKLTDQLRKKDAEIQELRQAIAGLQQSFRKISGKTPE